MLFLGPPFSRRLSLSAGLDGQASIHGPSTIVQSNGKFTPTVIDDGVYKRITLMKMKGPNMLRAAIITGGAGTDFCARFLDAEDKQRRFDRFALRFA